MSRTLAWVGVAVAGLALSPVAYNAWGTLAETRAQSAVAARHFAAGRAALEAGHVQKALAALNAAQAIRPLDAAVRHHVRLAQVHALLAQPNRVSTDDAPRLAYELERALDEGAPQPARFQVAVGILTQLTGEGSAEAWYRRAIETDEAVGEAPYFLGNLLAAAGRPAEAEPYLKRARTHLGDEPRVLQLQGLTYSAQKKWRLAAEVLGRASEIAPNAAVWTALAKAQVEQKQLAHAVTSLNAATQLVQQPADLAGLRAQLGVLYVQLNKHPEAIQQLEAALTLSPSVQIRFNLAVAHAAAGHHGRAAQLFNESVEASPELVAGHLKLVEALLSAGRADQAQRAAARFYELASNRPEWSEQVAWVRQRMAPRTSPE